MINKQIKKYKVYFFELAESCGVDVTREGVGLGTYKDEMGIS